MYSFYERGRHPIVDITKEQMSRVRELMEKYEDQPMDLADASLVVLAEHLKSGRIFSTDKKDFEAYRWNEDNFFENLFFSTPFTPNP